MNNHEENNAEVLFIKTLSNATGLKELFEKYPDDVIEAYHYASGLMEQSRTAS